MSKRQKKGLVKILAGSALLIAAMLLEHMGSYSLPSPGAVVVLVLFAGAYLLAGADVLLRAVRNIFRGKVFDENFLMAVATVGAIFLGHYSEAVAVMLFYQIGEWFQAYAVGKSRRSISSLMNIRPDYANRLMPDGNVETIDPGSVQVGDHILVKAGERIPLDGIVLKGGASLDTSSLTGEPLPREVAEGDEVISGCINLNGVLTIQATRRFEESTVSRILDLVENQSGKKAKAEHFITRFARYYTPLVCAAALLLAVVPPLVLGGGWGDWVYRALSFLVISCPCALVISVPLSYFGGIGGASREGILIKGSNYLEVLARVDTVVFDKTGTLTQGRFAVTQVSPRQISVARLLEIAAYAEYYSGHPVAASIKNAYGKTLNSARLGYAKEDAGFGVAAQLDGQQVLVGNARLMAREGIAFGSAGETGTVVHVAVDGEWAGYILVEDVVKPDAAGAVESLRQAGVQRQVMLTGDADAAGQKAARKIGLNKAYTQLLPEDKVQVLEAIMAEDGVQAVAYVGDGVNDAPVLARANVGIAMGGLGSDAAIEAADVVIMDDKPSKIAVARAISNKTLTIVRQNIAFAIGVKVVALVLSAFGIATMGIAIFADVGVSLLAILNALRALGPIRKKALHSTAARVKTSKNAAA